MARAADVKACEQVARGAGDREIKAFAAKILPTLQAHLQQVRELSTTVGPKKPTS